MITVSNITKKYKKELFKNISFIIPDTGLFFIKGKSGSGKTTLFKLILGLETADEGNIFIEKEESQISFSEARKNIISYLPTQGLLFKRLSLKDNLALFEKKFGISFNLNNIDSLLRYFDISYLSSKPLKKCSGGENKLLNLIFALSRTSNYIFLDEPYSELDRINKNKLKTLLKEIAKEKAVVIINHDENYSNEDDNSILIDLDSSQESKQEILARLPVNQKNNESIKNESINKIEVSKALLKDNFITIFLSFFIMIIASTTTICGGALFFNDAFSSNNDFIMHNDPYDFLQIAYRHQNIKSDINKCYSNYSDFISDDRFDGMFVLSLAKNDLFLSSENSDFLPNLNKNNKTNIEIIFSNEIPNYNVYYEVDEKYLGSAAIFDIEEDFEIPFIYSNEYRYEKNKSYFIKQENNLSNIDSEIFSRTDRIYCSFKNAPIFFNTVLLKSGLTSTDGKKLIENDIVVQNGNFNEEGFYEEQIYKLKVLDEDNIFGISGSKNPKFKNNDFKLNKDSNFLKTQLAVSSPFKTDNFNDVLTTLDCSSETGNTLYLSQNIIFTYLSGLDCGHFYISKQSSNSNFINDFNLIIRSPVFEGYGINRKSIGQIIFSIGLVFIALSSLIFVHCIISINKKRRLVQNLLSLGISKKHLKSAMIFLISIISIITAIFTLVIFIGIWSIMSNLSYEYFLTYSPILDRPTLYWVGRSSLYDLITTPILYPYNLYICFLIIFAILALIFIINFAVIKRGMKNVKD